MVTACDGHADSLTCQVYLKTFWPEMAKCLYDGWIFSNMTCYQFGGCLHSSQTWDCSGMGALMGQVLADAPYITYGAEQHLHGSCYCQSAAHDQDKDCQGTVSDLLPTVLPVFSSWVSESTICGNGVDGDDTCEPCRQETGKQELSYPKPLSMFPRIPHISVDISL